MENLYDQYILPRVTHWVCGSGPIMKQRQKIVPLAAGVVLEIGIGSGLNLPYYKASRVSEIFGLDPAPQMWELNSKELPPNLPRPRFLRGYADQIPLENDSVDTVLLTYTLCSIPQLAPAFEEIRRVLRPGGRMLFCEHGKAPDPGVARWQTRLEPVWKRLGGGCHLTRNMPQLIREGGFQMETLEQMYIPGFRPASYNYWGTALTR